MRIERRGDETDQRRDEHLPEYYLSWKRIVRVDVEIDDVDCKNNRAEQREKIADIEGASLRRREQVQSGCDHRDANNISFCRFLALDQKLKYRREDHEHSGDKTALRCGCDFQSDGLQRETHTEVHTKQRAVLQRLPISFPNIPNRVYSNEQCSDRESDTLKK